MHDREEFYIILRDLNSSAKYFEGDKEFTPTDEMIEALDDVATALYNMVLDNQK